MAKKNDNPIEKVVEKPIEELNGVTDTTEQTKEPQGAAVEGAAAVEEIQEELSVQQKPDNSKQTNDTEPAGLDTESQNAAIGAEGNNSEGGASTEESTEKSIEPEQTTEDRNRIAADVFEKNPQCKALFFTSDLIPFFVHSDAVRHGATLESDVIVTVNRE